MNRNAAFDRAIEIIRGAWTQGAMARNEDGNPTRPCSDRAVRFCAFGALAKAVHEQGVPVKTATVLMVASLFKYETAIESLVKFNDNAKSVEDVIERLKELKNEP